MLKRGGNWRFVENGPDGEAGFEGRFREIVPPSRVVETFEWDGMPGYVAVQDATLEDLGEGRTRVVTTSLFHTTFERDGVLKSGMEGGMNQSYAVLDRVLAKLRRTRAKPARRAFMGRAAPCESSRVARRAGAGGEPASPGLSGAPSGAPRTTCARRRLGRCRA